MPDPPGKISVSQLTDPLSEIKVKVSLCANKSTWRIQE